MHSFILKLQWAFYGGQGDGWFEDIDYITMFADYRVPQVLVYFGAMTYDEYLMKLLQEGICWTKHKFHKLKSNAWNDL